MDSELKRFIETGEGTPEFLLRIDEDKELQAQIEAALNEQVRKIMGGPTPLKFGYLRHDDSCHDYVIPEDEIKEFDALMDRFYEAPADEDEWYDICDEIDNRFGKYRVDGELQDMRIVLDEEE